MIELTAALKQRVLAVRCIALDVDGVLTDGRLIYLPDGTLTPSGFHVHDGMGVRIAIESGLKVIFVSGNWTDAVRIRAEHLRVTAHYLGVGDKTEALETASRELSVPLKNFAYVGDDLNDLAAMAKVGFPVAVGQAVDEVKRMAAYVSAREGGAGAVREIIELILREQGLWESAVARSLKEIEARGFAPGR